MSDSESDESLLTLAIVGDRAALTTLVERHSERVRRTLVGKISAKWQSVLSVDDVIQETCFDVVREIGRFEPRGDDAFFRWMCTLAKNNLLLAIRGLRTAKRGGDRTRVMPDEQTSYLNLYESLGGSVTSPSAATAFDEARTALDRALDKLPEHYRLVVSLYDLAGCSVDDVCETCECSQGAMFMRRSRAHAMLREVIGSTANVL